MCKIAENITNKWTWRIYRVERRSCRGFGISIGKIGTTGSRWMVREEHLISNTALGSHFKVCWRWKRLCCGTYARLMYNKFGGVGVSQTKLANISTASGKKRISSGRDMGLEWRGFVIKGFDDEGTCEIRHGFLLSQRTMNSLLVSC